MKILQKILLICIGFYVLTYIVTWLTGFKFKLNILHYKEKQINNNLHLQEIHKNSNNYFLPNIQYNKNNVSISEPLVLTSLQSKVPAVTCKQCPVLAIVCCGERLNETLIVIKTAIALSTSPFTIEVFTEETLIPYFSFMSSEWLASLSERVKVNIHLASYPEGVNDKLWRSLFRECASTRLFLPALLPNVDSLIYVDTDVLFLAPIEKIWLHFQKMNRTQMVALAQEHEDPATGWYNRFAKHPFYGKLGVNSGVMLMNLTRLREFGWMEYLTPIHKEFHKVMSWGDQDIINIIFHYHPDKLYLYGCEYNYRPDHCMYMSVCKSAERNGVFALHGNRRVYHNDKQPSFKAIYKAWEQYKLGEDLRQYLYYPMQKYLILNRTSNCGKIYKIFLMNIEKLIKL